MKPCNGCGKCCEKYSGPGLGSATDADIDRLENADRWDVLVWMPPPLYDFWVSPITGEETHRCPWLRKVRNQDKYKCRIYEDRPDVCRNYPVDLEQMVDDECEMLEPQDLKLSRRQFRALLKKMRNSTISR